MKNSNLYIYMLALLPLLSSCGTLRISKMMHSSDTSITNEVNAIQDSLSHRLDQNQAIIRNYSRLDSLIDDLYGQDILNLAQLNLSATYQVRNVLLNPPAVTKITDKMGITRIAKSLSDGNTYIGLYVSDLWNYFYRFMSTPGQKCFNQFWNEFLEDYPTFKHPTPFQVHPEKNELYIYLAFQHYYEALVDPEIRQNEKVFHEKILLGNLNFFLVEQLVAQDFIRKALTIRPLGANPFNIGGRKVEVVLDGRTYSNKHNEILDLTTIQSNEVKELLRLFDPLEYNPVQYHRYVNRMPFILSIGVREHQLFVENLSDSKSSELATQE